MIEQYIFQSGTALSANVLRANKSNPFPPEADDSRHVLGNKVKSLHIAKQSYIH